MTNMPRERSRGMFVSKSGKVLLFRVARNRAIKLSAAQAEERVRVADLAAAVERAVHDRDAGH